MQVARAVALFVAAGVAEIGGGYLVWRCLREDGSWWLGLLGALVLVGWCRDHQPRRLHHLLRAAQPLIRRLPPTLDRAGRTQCPRRRVALGAADDRLIWHDQTVDEGTDDLLHPLLVSPRSPTTFDPAASVSRAEVESLLEAARWAPSAGNSQPWAFIVGRRGEPDHDRLARHLAKSSAAWAPMAGVLIGNLSHRFVEDTDWDYSEFSTYDLGQAVAHMSFQAQSLGLYVRQFRAFDRDALAAEFDVPPHWEVTTMSAIGRVPSQPPRPASSGEPRHVRQRRSPTDILWPLASTVERR